MKNNNPTSSNHNGLPETTEPRAPSVLLLDVSGSTSAQWMRELGAGLSVYHDALAADSVAAKRVEIAIVAFGGEVRTLCDFTLAEHFHPPRLVAGGASPLGAAIHQGIDLVQERKQFYWSHQVNFYRPWIFVISGSAPTDLWRSAADRVRHGEVNRAFSLFAVGGEGADFDTLRRFTMREPLRLKGLRFADLFRWLSNSQCAVSRSPPGNRVLLKNPAAVDGWAEPASAEIAASEPQT